MALQSLERTERPILVLIKSNISEWSSQSNTVITISTQKNWRWSFKFFGSVSRMMLKKKKKHPETTVHNISVQCLWLWFDDLERAPHLSGCLASLTRLCQRGRYVNIVLRLQSTSQLVYINRNFLWRKHTTKKTGCFYCSLSYTTGFIHLQGLFLTTTATRRAWWYHHLMIF